MAADSTQTASPTSVGEINNAVPFTGGNVRWANFANALVIDGSVAICPLAIWDESYGLIFKGFPFNLPNEAVIKEIRVIATAKIDESNLFLDAYVTPAYPDFSLISSNSTLITTSLLAKTWTFSREELVGITPAIVNNTGAFGVAIGETYPGGTKTINIDGLTVEIDFESAPRPEYANTILLDKVALSAANTNRDGTGTLGFLGDIVDTFAGGTIVNRLEITATGATTVGMIRVFLARGETAEFSHLFAEIPVSAITPSVSVEVWSGIVEFPGGLIFSTFDAQKAAYEKIDIRVGTHNAEAFNVFAFGSQYE